MTRHEFANLRGETFIGFLAGIGVAHALNAKLAWVRTAGGFHAMIETDIEGDLAQAVFDGLPRALPILKGADGSRVSLLRHAMADDFHRALLDESDERAKSFHAAVAASTPRVKQKIKMDTDETAAKKTIKERKARKKHNAKLAKDAEEVQVLIAKAEQRYAEADALLANAIGMSRDAANKRQSALKKRQDADDRKNRAAELQAAIDDAEFEYEEAEKTDARKSPLILVGAGMTDFFATVAKLSAVCTLTHIEQTLYGKRLQYESLKNGKTFFDARTSIANVGEDVALFGAQSCIGLERLAIEGFRIALVSPQNGHPAARMLHSNVVAWPLWDTPLRLGSVARLLDRPDVKDTLTLDGGGAQARKTLRDIGVKSVYSARILKQGKYQRNLAPSVLSWSSA